MTEKRIRILEQELVSYVLAEDEPTEVPDLDTRLNGRLLQFSCHVPAIFPGDKYHTYREFMEANLEKMDLAGAYYFRTGGIWERERDHDHFKVVSFVKVQEIPQVIPRFRQGIHALCEETHQDAIFFCIGRQAGFVKGGDPANNRIAQKLLSIGSVAEELEAPKGFLEPGRIKLVTIRGNTHGQFMDRLLSGIESMAHTFSLAHSVHVGSVEDALRRVIGSKERPNGIFIHHGSVQNRAAVDQALSELPDDIKITAFDTPIESDRIGLVSQDDMYMSLLLAKQIEDDFFGKGSVDVLYMNDPRQYLPLKARDAIWRRAVEFYPRIRMTAFREVDAEDPGACRQALEELLRERIGVGHGRDHAIVAMWDEFAKVAVQVVGRLTEQGTLAPGSVRVYSVDLVEDGLEMMKEFHKTWAATVAADPFQIGRLAVRLNIAMIAGRSAGHIKIAPSLITSAFLHQYGIDDLSSLDQLCNSFSESPLEWYPWMPRDNSSLVKQGGFHYGLHSS